jgi:hypothetical protein
MQNDSTAQEPITLAMMGFTLEELTLIGQGITLVTHQKPCCLFHSLQRANLHLVIARAQHMLLVDGNADTEDVAACHKLITELERIVADLDSRHRATSPSAGEDVH